MTWAQIADNRTDQQVKDNYTWGKEQQADIISRLKKIGTCIDLSQGDKFKDNVPSEDYFGDCKIEHLDGIWRLIEIKNNRKKHKDVFWKKYQYDRALKNWVHLLVVAEGYYFYTPRWMPDSITIEPVSGKEVVVYKDVDRQPLEKLYLIFER